MRSLRKIAFVLQEFALQTPAQQLLDRFLIGYPRDGVFHRVEDCQIAVYLPVRWQNVALDRRQKDFGLVREGNIEQVLANADAVVVVWKGAGVLANESLLRDVLEKMPGGSACFVQGVLSKSLDGANELIDVASVRNVSLAAGTPTAVTWRLPEVDLAPGTHLQDALIVVQGAPPIAEMHGLQGLLPVIERRRGGESGVRRIRLFKGKELWQAGEEGFWSKALLAAAISRSNTPQGDPVKDGRTQDLVGLGLVPTLARDPRGWIIDHQDGLRSAILVLDGVVADFNFAVRARDGTVVSAQLYRPPAPAEQHFSRLTAVIEDFFRSGTPQWPAGRNLLMAGLLEAASKVAKRPGQFVETPQLDVAYSR
ncbi:MAG TPA: hypothetical protein VFA77_04865 [Candidatus Eisenbacteria bacterium]|nr:hypothetical protein [Candidatus Eisenbacteria bacterium]